MNLSEIITIQVKEKVPNDMGGFTVSWVDKFSRVRASIYSLRGREAFEADKVGEKNTYRIRVRRKSISGISGDMRIKWGNNILEIDSVPLVQISSIHRDIIAIDNGETV